MTDKNISDYRIDLHIHTNYSDGTQSVEQLLCLSSESNIRIISFTDHNTMNAYQEVNTLADKYEFAYIPGIELSSTYNGRHIHLLGYGIDISDPMLNLLCKEYKYREYDRDIRVLRQLTRENNSIIHEYKGYTYPSQRGGWKLLNFMLDKKLCKNIDAYFKILDHTENGSVVYETISEVSKIIQKAGGFSILAHPGVFWVKEECIDVLHDVSGLGINGVECLHPLNNAQIEDISRSFCDNNDLLVTGGSDTHGNLPDRNLGVPFIQVKDIVLGHMIDRICFT